MADNESDLPTRRSLAALDEMAAAWAIEAKIDAMCAAAEIDDRTPTAMSWPIRETIGTAEAETP